MAGLLTRVRSTTGRSLRRAVMSSPLTRIALSRHKDSAAIFMFHGVEQRELKAFVAIIDWIQAQFDIVPLDEIADDRPSAHSRTRAAITFDDGLRNNFTVAYPYLLALKLPATFYVCPGLISANRTLWTYEMRARLQACTTADLENVAGALNLSRASRDHIIATMKTLRTAEREAIEEQVRSRTPDFQFTEEQRHRYRLMGWDELLCMDPAIATIGSHTHSHPELGNCSDEEISTELTRSRDDLQERLSRPVLHLAYPGGSHNPRVVAIAQKLYRSAVTIVPGLNGPAQPAHTLKRIHVPLDPEQFSGEVLTIAARGK